MIPLCLYYFATFAALGAYVPFFPPWLEARGIGGLAMGAFTATAPAMGVLGPPVFGAIADRFGLRRSLLRAACAGAFVAFASIALAGFLGIPLGVTTLYALVLLFALCRAPLIMMADVITLEQVRRQGGAYSRVRVWGSAGFLVMALCAGLVVDPTARGQVPLAIAAPLLIALGATLWLPKAGALPPRPVAGPARSVLAHPAHRLFLAVAFLHNLAHSSHELTLSLYVRSLGGSSALTGSMWALGVLAEVFLMAASAPVFRRVSAARCVALSVWIAAGRWLLIALTRSPWVLLALQPLHAITFGLAWLGSLRYIEERASQESLATFQGLFSGAIGAGAVVGMLVWGETYGRYGGAATFELAAAVSAVAGVVAFRFLERA